MSNSSKTFRNIVIVLFIILLMSIVLFVMYEKSNSNTNITPTINVPNNQSGVDLNTNNSMSQEQIIQIAKQRILAENGLIDKNNSNKIWIVTGIVVFILIIGMIYYLFIFKKKDDEDKSLKQPIPIDRVKYLFKEKIAKEYDLTWYVDENKNFQLSNPKEFYYRDQKPFYHRATGDKFLLVEFVINNGPRFGFHIAVIPVDRGEKAILEGDYTIQHQTDYKDYSGKWKSYPITSIVDKRERQAMYIAEQMADGNMNAESVDYLKKSQSQQDDKFPNNKFPNQNRNTSFISPFSGNYDDGDDDGMDDEDDNNVNISSVNRPISRVNKSRRRYKR